MTQNFRLTPEETIERLRALNNDHDLGLHGALKTLSDQLIIGNMPKIPEGSDAEVFPVVPLSLSTMIGVCERDDRIPFEKASINLEDVEQLESEMPAEPPRWVVLDPNLNRDSSVDHVRGSVDRACLPRVELLLLWAIAPEKIKQFRDRTGVCGMDVAGLYLPGRAGCPRSRVLYLRWPFDNREFKIVMVHAVGSQRCFSIPLRREK